MPGCGKTFREETEISSFRGLAVDRKSFWIMFLYGTDHGRRNAMKSGWASRSGGLPLQGPPVLRGLLFYGHTIVDYFYGFPWCFVIFKPTRDLFWAVKRPSTSFTALYLRNSTPQARQTYSTCCEQIEIYYDKVCQKGIIFLNIQFLARRDFSILDKKKRHMLEKSFTKNRMLDICTIMLTTPLRCKYHDESNDYDRFLIFFFIFFRIFYGILVLYHDVFS